MFNFIRHNRVGLFSSYFIAQATESGRDLSQGKGRKGNRIVEDCSVPGIVLDALHESSEQPVR